MTALWPWQKLAISDRKQRCHRRQSCRHEDGDEMSPPVCCSTTSVRARAAIARLTSVSYEPRKEWSSVTLLRLLCHPCSYSSSSPTFSLPLKVSPPRAKLNCSSEARGQCPPLPPLIQCCGDFSFRWSLLADNSSPNIESGGGRGGGGGENYS